MKIIIKYKINRFIIQMIKGDKNESITNTTSLNNNIFDKIIKTSFKFAKSN